MRLQTLPFILLLFIQIGTLCAQDIPTDSIVVKKKIPQFFAINTMGGIVLPTNDFIKNEGSTIFNSLSLKYGIYSSGDTWQDKAYGMPYYGIGFYGAKFFDKKALGTPFSVYLFQGAEIKKYSRKVSLYYELNLGMSFNWKPYDAFDNPNNIALGSSVNIHVGANLYLKTPLSNKLDLRYGVGVSHFSNGAYQLPNKGLNMISPFVELVYNLQGSPKSPSDEEEVVPPQLDERFDFDLTFTSSTRQVRMDTVGTGLPSRYIDKKFKVFGLSYSAMYVKNYKYKWGPSVEIVYDESSNVRAWRQKHPIDGQYYDRVKLGSFYDRLSLGISLRGEITYPHHAFFAHFGYNILHGNDYDFRLYQILGVKAYLTDNIFGTFGIRAARFSKAQYIYWSIGYTFKGKPIKKGSPYSFR